MSAPTSASQAAHRAKRHPLETLGRVGYAVKGVLYVLLGALAVQAAFGSGDPEGQQGMFRSIAGSTWGEVVLWVLVVGLAAYALWRFVLAVANPEREGAVHRVGYVISGVAYGALAFSAYGVVSGGGGSGGSGGTEERTQTLLGLPGGRWIVGAIGLGVIGYGVYQFVRAYKGSFMEKLHLEGAAARNREWVRRAGEWGLSARGVVYLLVGGFLVQAALQADPDEAGGLDQALTTLQQQPYGPWLLGLVALGLVLYGVYCGVNAVYRRYEEA
jgi:hypothetical protein